MTASAYDAAGALRREMAEAARRTFAPRNRVTGSEWANTKGWIARSSGAAEGGPYSTDRAPYMAEIIDVICDETHPDVVFNKPAQVGFTEAINQCVGFAMEADPSGVIVIQPNDGMAKAWMKERIDPMVAESPALQGIIRSEGGRRNSDDTMQRKVFSGGWLVAVGANAPSGLRSRPARRLYGDERSGWTLDARNQGDPWDLGGERTSTFWNAKRVQGSTPGEAGTCPITDALADSDLRRYHVVCPACGRPEPFTWRDRDGTYRLVFDKDPAGTIIPATAHYLCTACGVLVPPREKPRMTRPGNGARWIATHPGRDVVGFDLNGLISPWRTWEDIGKLWRDAQGKPEKLKVFVTHVLAEPWKPAAERIDVHVLRDRATEPAVAPPGAALCTAFIDVQGNRIESLVVAWGAGEESWTLDWQQHGGDPTQPGPWESALDALRGDFGAPIAAIGIDTNYLKDEVWRWVDRWNGQAGLKVLGCKGTPGRGLSVMRRPVAAKKRHERHPWMIGTDTAKDLLSLRLRQPVPPGGPGAVHFAATLDPVFFDQLTSEERRPVMVSGRPTMAWRLPAGRRNEALDLWVGCLAVLYSLGTPVLARLGEMAAQRQPSAAPTPPPTRPARAARLPHGSLW